MKQTFKYLIAILVFSSVITSCDNSQKWEYKIISVNGVSYQEDPEKAAFYELNFDSSEQEAKLNQMGADGWELIGVYTNTNTAYPNFGDNQYVTGIKNNVRTSCVNYVFKRKVGSGSNKAKDATPSDSI